MSITYIEKIIRNFQLFALEEDGSFSPEELNPLKKKEKKTARSDRANAVADTKNDENRQKTTEEKMEISNEKQANALNTSTDKEIGREVFKENIKDILTTAAEEKERNAAAADFSNVESRRTDTAACCTVATVQRSQCHTSPLPVLHFSVPNAALHTCSSVAFHPFKCGIGDAEVWHSGGSSARFAFIATTVHGSDSKILLCRPEADGSIRVFRSLYSLGNNIFRIGGIHRVSVRAVDDVGRYLSLIHISEPTRH